MKTLFKLTSLLLTCVLTSCIKTDFGGFMNSIGVKELDYAKSIHITNDTIYHLDGKYYVKISVGEKNKTLPYTVYLTGCIITDLSEIHDPIFSKKKENDQSDLLTQEENKSRNKVIFFPLKNSKNWGFDYENHVPLDKFDMKRARPCGYSSEWHHLVRNSEEIIQKKEVSCFIHSESHPRKTALNYSLLPLTVAGYVIDVPCTIAASGILWAASPFLYIYHNHINPDDNAH